MAGDLIGVHHEGIARPVEGTGVGAEPGACTPSGIAVSDRDVVWSGERVAILLARRHGAVDVDLEAEDLFVAEPALVGGIGDEEQIGGRIGDRGGQRESMRRFPFGGTTRGLVDLHVREDGARDVHPIVELAQSRNGSPRAVILQAGQHVPDLEQGTRAERSSGELELRLVIGAAVIDRIHLIGRCETGEVVDARPRDSID